MNISFRPTFTLMLGAVLLTGCAFNQRDSAPQEQNGDPAFILGTTNERTLVLPPDLINSSSVQVRTPENVEVLPELVGVAIQRENGKSWLRVDAAPRTVWKTLREFWALQGIELVESDPRAGIMVTDWFNRDAQQRKNRSESTDQVAETEDTEDTEIAEIAEITDFSTLEQFTLRLQRHLKGGTDVFVSHRGREKIAQKSADAADIERIEWVEQAQDSEKVARFLQTLVLLFET